MLPSIMLLRGFVAGEVSAAQTVPLLLVHASVSASVGDVLGEAMLGSPTGISLTPPPVTTLASAAPWWKRWTNNVVAFIMPKSWRA